MTANYLSIAIEAAEQINKSKEAGKEITTFIGASNVKKRGAANMALLLADVLSEETILGLPEQGTKQEDVKGTNAPWDIHKEKAFDGTKNKTITVSVYGTLFERLETGAALVAEKSTIKERLEKGQLTKWQAESETRRLDSAIRNGTNLVGNAIACLKHLALARGLEFVTVQWNTETEKDGAERLVKGHDTIVAFETGKPQNFETMTVSQFLGYDVAAAIENGGTWEAFKKEKGKRSGNPPEGSSIRNAKDLYEYVNELSSYLATPEGKRTLLAALNAKESMELSSAIVKLAQEMDIIVSNDAYPINKNYKAIEAWANRLEQQVA